MNMWISDMVERAAWKQVYRRKGKEDQAVPALLSSFANRVGLEESIILNASRGFAEQNQGRLPDLRSLSLALTENARDDSFVDYEGKRLGYRGQNGKYVDGDLQSLIYEKTGRLEESG